MLGGRAASARDRRPALNETTDTPPSEDLRSRIHRTLRRRFAEGRYGDGDLLTEQGVADEFGVSRTPAREALGMLASDGFLLQEGRGFVLPRWRPEDIALTFEVRARLEPAAVRLAAERASDDELAALAGLLDGLEGLDEDGYIAANRAIRAAVFRLARNRPLLAAIETFEQQTAHIRQKTLRDARTVALSKRLNRRLLETLMRREVAEAERTMEQILQAAQVAMLIALMPSEASDAAS